VPDTATQLKGMAPRERWAVGQSSSPEHPAQRAAGWFALLKAASLSATLYASPCTVAFDPWTSNPLVEMTTSPALRKKRRVISLRRAREIAIEVLLAAEDARAAFAEDDARRTGLVWAE
jgi:hypothetical protein